MTKEQIEKAKEKSAPLLYKMDNYPFDIKYCIGYEGYIPQNLDHEVCKHCGCIEYYH